MRAQGIILIKRPGHCSIDSGWSHTMTKTIFKMRSRLLYDLLWRFRMFLANCCRLNRFLSMFFRYWSQAGSVSEFFASSAASLRCSKKPGYDAPTTPSHAACVVRCPAASGDHRISSQESSASTSRSDSSALSARSTLREQSHSKARQDYVAWPCKYPLDSCMPSIGAGRCGPRRSAQWSCQTSSATTSEGPDRSPAGRPRRRRSSSLGF